MLNIIEIVIVRPDRGFVSVADGATPWRALFDHMTIMTNGFERLVDYHSQFFDQFQIGLASFLE